MASNFPTEAVFWLKIGDLRFFGMPISHLRAGFYFQRALEGVTKSRLASQVGIPVAPSALGLAIVRSLDLPRDLGKRTCYVEFPKQS